MLRSALALTMLVTGAAHAQCVPEPKPFPSPIGGIQNFGEFQGQLLVMGDNPTISHIARWDGARWQPLGSGPGRIVLDSIELGGELYVCGSFPSKVSRWTGTAWQQVGSGFPTTGTSVRRMAVYRGELIVAGKFTTVGGQAMNNITRWDGAAWQPLGAGCNKEVIDLAVFNDELIACGYLTAAGGQPANYIARWNGSSWSPLGSGFDLWASTLTVHEGQLYAGGIFQTAGGRPAALVARYDGSEWHALGAGLSGTAPQNFVNTMTSYRGQLFVGGMFRSAGGVPVTFWAGWTGDQWFAIDTIPNFPYAISEFQGDLHLGSLSLQLRRYTCPCPADINGDGFVDFADYLDFLDLFDAGDPAADLNEDGFIDSTDWMIFFDLYSGGC